MKFYAIPKTVLQRPVPGGRNTQVTRVHSDGIELLSTVAYPEGGGQEADVGTIELPVGTVRFVWVKKLYGSPIRLEGFKGGKLGGIIIHSLHPDDLHCWMKSPWHAGPRHYRY
jgi:Ser-tRNA(Ala) deacylase AlaX